MEQGTAQHARETERLAALSYAFDFTRNGGEFSGWWGQVTPFGYWRIVNRGLWWLAADMREKQEKRTQRRDTEGAEKRRKRAA